MSRPAPASWRSRSRRSSGRPAAFSPRTWPRSGVRSIAERTAEAGLDNVEFRAMGAERLDLPDASFDVALCQFGLMFVPDPVQALREMRRVLRDGGRLGVVVWSTIDRVPCHGAIQRFLAPYQPRSRRRSSSRRRCPSGSPASSSGTSPPPDSARSRHGRTPSTSSPPARWRIGGLAPRAPPPTCGPRSTA